ncbi:MAG TPA: helix-turn-helix domain-containing protein [Thermoanaerobaculia bacterium]|nr:helix-turn-helix domain-containing protein [Thermoanaerobaculia bacterium]
MPRTYTKVLRAAAEEETRLRIVEALIELHAEVGPARTTVSAVAERAGVERLTVYRHFPDEPAMFRACSSLYMQRNPPPAPVQHEDPLPAVRKTLVSVYAWYRSNEAMFANVLKDLEVTPSLRESTEGLLEYVDAVASALDRLFGDRRTQRKATIHHALEFSTWQSLSRLTRSDRAAADLATTWLE